MLTFLPIPTVCLSSSFLSFDFSLFVSIGAGEVLSKNTESDSLRILALDLSPAKPEVDESELILLPPLNHVVATNENLNHTESEKSDIQCRRLEEQTKCAELEKECSKLRSELCEEQRLHKDIQTEFSDFKEQTYNAVDKEIENHRRIEKLHLQEVNELKTEIKRLKSELSNSGNTSNSTKVQTGAHQGVGAEIGTTSVKKQSAKNNICRRQSSFRMSQMWKRSVSSPTTVSI